MSDRIDDLLRDTGEKHLVTQEMDRADKGILILQDGDEGWRVRMFGVTLSDMAFALRVASALLDQHILVDEDEEIVEEEDEQDSQ